jgi:hypothetical protein
MIQDTCNFKECYLGKLLDKPEECPNFIQSGWKSEEGAEVKTIKDCAPKRTFLMIQGLHNRLTGVEKSQEEQMNRVQSFFDLKQSGLTRHESLER